MTRPRLLALAALCFLLAAWVGFRLTAPPPPAPLHATTWKPGARASLPRPEPAARRSPAAEGAGTGPAAPAPAAVPPPAEAEAPPPSDAPPAAPDAPADDPPPGQLLDRREGDHRDGAALMADLQARLDVARDDITACVGQWTALDPGLAGEVNLGFQLDATGLTDVWVVDQTDVPFGPKSCFGTAIAAVDWSGITPAPVEVTLNFSFDADHPGG